RRSSCQSFIDPRLFIDPPPKRPLQRSPRRGRESVGVGSAPRLVIDRSLRLEKGQVYPASGGHSLVPGGGRPKGRGFVPQWLTSGTVRANVVDRPRGTGLRSHGNGRDEGEGTGGGDGRPAVRVRRPGGGRGPFPVHAPAPDRDRVPQRR